MTSTFTRHEGLQVEGPLHATVLRHAKQELSVQAGRQQEWRWRVHALHMCVWAAPVIDACVGVTAP
jgi:hypothetical protein